MQTKTGSSAHDQEKDQDDDFFVRQPDQKSWLTSQTCKGIGAVFAGMCIQAALGIESIWGNIVIYVASKYRGTDPNLSI